jgi:hypothetical protein
LAPRFAAATTFKEVEEILVSNHFTLEYIKSKVAQPSSDKEAKWGPAIAEYLGKLEIAKHLEGVDAFTAIIDPTEVELEIIRSDRLEEAIDRTIKRLVQTKTYKQLLPSARAGGVAPKVIDVAPTKIIESANTNKKGEQPRDSRKSCKACKTTGAGRDRSFKGEDQYSQPKPINSIAPDPMAEQMILESSPSSPKGAARECQALIGSSNGHARPLFGRKAGC